MIDRAVALTKEVCHDVEMACSRFRDDSEIMLLHGQPGNGREVSDTLAAIVRGALAAAERTDCDGRDCCEILLAINTQSIFFSGLSDP